MTAGVLLGVHAEPSSGGEGHFNVVVVIRAEERHGSTGQAGHGLWVGKPETVAATKRSHRDLRLYGVEKLPARRGAAAVMGKLQHVGAELLEQRARQEGVLGPSLDVAGKEDGAAGERGAEHERVVVL